MIARVVGLALAAFLAGCETRPAPLGYWRVAGTISVGDAANVLTMVEVARDVLVDEGGLLEDGGTIYMEPSIVPPCPERWPYVTTGCIDRGVRVLWPHPTGGFDLTESALPHELGHLATNFAGEVAASVAGTLIVEEYRRRKGL